MKYSVNVTRFTEVECGHVVVKAPSDATEKEIARTVQRLFAAGLLDCDYWDAEYGNVGYQVFPDMQETEDADSEEECVVLARKQDGRLGLKEAQEALG